MDEIKDILEKIKNRLIEKVDPLSIIVFGSYVRKTQNNESDIDIAIKAENMTKSRILELKQELEDISNKEIDLVDLDLIENDGFRYEILMNGQSIYCKDTYKFDLYKIDMIREYLELNEMRKPIIDNIKKGGNIYGK